MGKRVGETPAQNSVTVDDKDIIVIVIRGKQDAESVRLLALDLNQKIRGLESQNKKINMYCDVRGLKLNDLTSSARIESKKLMNLPVHRGAIVGQGAIISIVAYLLRFSAHGTRRFFTSSDAAYRWLHDKERTAQSRPVSSLIIGATILLIGITGLLGWCLGNDYLTRWIPTLRPINPVAAVGLLAAGTGFVFYYFNKLLWLKIAGVFGVLLGVAALSPLDIDHILFASQVQGAHTELSDSAAWCFIALGLSPFTVGTKRVWVRLLQYALAGMILGLSLVNIFGQLYAHDALYAFSPTFVMAFNLALAFLLVGLNLILIILYRQMGSVLVRISRLGWLIVFALIGIQLLTYGAWAQAQNRNTGDSSRIFMERAKLIYETLDQRHQTYIDALYGFRGLFAASQSVEQGEFQSYYDSLNLAQTYPGLRALSFVSKVSDKDLDSFAKLQQNDRSLHKEGNPKFAITSKTSLPEHYIVTFVANSATIGGSDLGASPDRLAAFRKAEATNQPVASGTLEFAASATAPAQKGFFVTIPVSTKGNTRTAGFVNAVFSYDQFFTRALQSGDWTRLTLSVRDLQDGTTIYSKKDAPDNAPRKFSDNITVADRTWHLEVSAAQDFGISQSQIEFPKLVLAGGQLFSLLMIGVFVLQNRSRQQALDLADRITEDLHRERNMAVANDRKSNAILESIGDAVFAIDTHKRITLFNPAAVQVSGHSQDEALGKPYTDILTFVFEKDKKPNTHFVEYALKGHVTSMKNHTLLIHKDGREVAVADSAAPIRNAQGHTIGVIVVFRDVSKEQALDKAKTEFVSLASHQLRTPLSAINWFSEMLLNGDAGKVNKDQHEYLQEIYDGNQRMIELVDSLLNVSRLEVGKLKNDPQPTSMQGITDSLMKELQTSIASKQMIVSLKVPPSLPTVFADPKLLRMVVQNLMTNAIKYTDPKGRVALTMREATAEDIRAGKLHPGRYMYLSVADNGYGIPKSQQDKIFQKLFRADNVRKLDVEGTGLGLYIIKEVAEKLGGTVWFESIEGKGTTFSVLIPFKTHAS